MALIQNDLCLKARRNTGVRYVVNYTWPKRGEGAIELPAGAIILAVDRDVFTVMAYPVGHLAGKVAGSIVSAESRALAIPEKSLVNDIRQIYLLTDIYSIDENFQHVDKNECCG
jgi:hypothetical protein